MLKRPANGKKDLYKRPINNDLEKGFLYVMKKDFYEEKGLLYVKREVPDKCRQGDRASQRARGQAPARGIEAVLPYQGRVVSSAPTVPFPPTLYSRERGRESERVTARGVEAVLPHQCCAVSSAPTVPFPPTLRCVCERESERERESASARCRSCSAPLGSRSFECTNSAISTNAVMCMQEKEGRKKERE